MAAPFRLTQKFVKDVQSAGKKQRFSDHEVGGLTLRVTEKGVKSWVIRYRNLEGAQKEMSLGRADALTIEMARKAAREKLATVSSGHDPIEEKREAIRAAQERKARTVEGLIEQYRNSPAYLDTRAATRTGYDGNISLHILPEFGDTPVEEVSRGKVAAFLDRLSVEHSGWVSNSARSTLSTIMSFAVERELIDVNPVWAVKKRQPAKVRERTLSDQELKTTWEAAEAGEGMTASVATMIKLCALLPARCGEVAGMRWEELDLDAALWSIPGERMKNHKPHEAPLSASAVAILGAIERNPELPWVFPNKAKTEAFDGKVIGRACNRLAKGKGWNSFGPHDLRKTIATRLAEMGFAPHIVERLLSHDVASGRAIASYDFYAYRDEKRRAVEAWERELLRIVEGREDEASNVVSLMGAGTTHQ